MVYLIHFKSSFHHCNHYIGFTVNLKSRMYHHRNGTGAKILKKLNELGIDYKVVRTWEEDGNFERKLKDYKKSSHFCPICNKAIKEFECNFKERRKKKKTKTVTEDF